MSGLLRDFKFDYYFVHCLTSAAPDSKPAVLTKYEVNKEAMNGQVNSHQKPTCYVPAHFPESERNVFELGENRKLN